MEHDDIPNTKLSGLKIWPNGPDLTESMVPGSRSTKMARGTYLLPVETRADLQRGLGKEVDVEKKKFTAEIPALRQRREKKMEIQSMQKSSGITKCFF